MAPRASPGRVYACAAELGCRTRPTFDPDAGRGHVATVEDVRVEVDLARPLHRLHLRIDADQLEELATLPDRCEHSAGVEDSADIDVLHCASENDSRIQ
jgi:hypothetical protein